MITNYNNKMTESYNNKMSPKDYLYRTRELKRIKNRCVNELNHILRRPTDERVEKIEAVAKILEIK